MPDLSLKVLGAFSASLGDRSISEFRTNKVRTLLIYLAVEQGPQDREALLSFLWPGLPELSARANLRQIVYYLRKLIPEVCSRDGEQKSVPLVIANRQALQLNPAADVGVDVAQFDMLVRSTQEHGHEELCSCVACLDTLTEAIKLYEGNFLADVFLDDSDPFEDWAQMNRNLYRHKALNALDVVTSSYLQRNEFTEAQALAERQLEIDNLHEPAYRQLMEILALNDQRPEAMAVYESCRRLFAEELSMAPSKRTKELYDKISVGDLSFEQVLVQRVQGYDLKEKIGEGAYGTIHRALQPSIGREVAIKVIQRDYANDPQFIRRFEAEAQTVARLEHPHIVPLYDYWRDPEGAYLVMRYLRGGSLLDSLENGPWDLEPTARLLDQVAGALSAAHLQGVIHRDIKPGNILLDEAGNAFLTDFGIAKDLTSQTQNTTEYSVVGTPDYFSPEQIKNDQVSVQSDIYSLGLVLYETLTGEKPFPDTSVVNLIYCHLNEPVPLVGSSRPDLEADVDDVIQRATAKQPSERYGSAMEMATAFRSVLVGSDIDEVVIRAPGQPLVPVIYNPYKGLRAFQENDADDFFGRDALVEQILARLELSVHSSSGQAGNGLGTGASSRFLAVVGPSGSGKSSVVKAGLIPALRNGALPGSDRWFIAEMVPGTHPLEELEIALWSLAVDPPPSLVEPMQRDTRGMLRTIRRILPDQKAPQTAGAPNGAVQLLLVIDQFEELYTLVDDDERRQFFIDSLLAAVQAPRSPLRVIVTLRADFYDRPLQHPHLGQFLKANTEIVLPLNHIELTWAIREPARRMGVSVAQDLVEEIVRDVIDQPGALPLLQYALTELFDGRQDNYITRSAYEEIGGVAGALGRRAEGIYTDLDEGGRDATRQLFLRLVTINEGISDSGVSPDTRRRVLRSELAALATKPITSWSGQQPASGNEQIEVTGLRSPIPAVVDAFGSARLLTFDRDPATREPTVEIAHEALLREWPRFRNWLDESRADVRLQRMLARAAAEWLAADHDPGFLLRDARLDHFAGWVLTSSVALTGVERSFLDASIDAREARQAEERDRQRRELETARKLAATEKARAELEQARAETERGRAEEQARAAGRLRRRAFLLSGALVVAALLAVAAVFFARQSEQNADAAQESADLAITREAQALFEADQRATAEANALAQASTAEAAQSEAQTQQSLAEEQAERADSAAAEAQTQRIAAEEQAKLTSSRELAAASINYRDVDSELGVLLALQALSIADIPEARNALYGSVPELRLLSTISGPFDPITDFDMNHDGTLLAFTDRSFVRLWDLLSEQEILARNIAADREFTNLHRAIALSPDGNFMSFVGRRLDQSNQNLGFYPVIFDIGLQRPIDNLDNHGRVINDLQFSPGGELVALALSGGEISIWDTASGEETLYLQGHADSDTVDQPARSGTLKVAFNPDGNFLASAGADGSVKIWDLTLGQLNAEVSAHLGETTSLAFSPEGRRLATGGHDGAVRIWQLGEGSGDFEEVLTLYINRPIYSVDYSSDGNLLATGGADGVVQVWDAASGNKVLNLTGHQGAITRVRFTDDGARLVTSSHDATVKIWDITPDRDLITLLGNGSSMESVSFSSSGDSLATMQVDGTLLVWDADTGENIFVQPSEAMFDAALYSPDGSRLAKVSSTSNVEIIDSRTGELQFELSGITSRAQALAWSPDGTLLATSGLVGDVNIWDAGSGEPLITIDAHRTGLVPGLAFSPDSRRLVSVGWDNLAVFWDARSGALISTLATPDFPQRVVFSPDGSLLAVSGSDGTVELWNVATDDPQFLVAIKGHTVPVPGLAFSPDGAQLAVGSLDGTVKIWDVRASIRDGAGQELSTLSYHEGGVLDVVYSPDGHRLATASQDGSVRLMIMDFEELVDLAKKRLTRGFTEAECQQYLHLESCPVGP